MRALFFTLCYDGARKKEIYMNSYLIDNIGEIMKNEERGIISSEAAFAIKLFLDLEGLNIEQLRGKRNDVVLIMGNYMKLIDDDTKENNDRIYKISDHMSAVTAVIDNEIFKLGGEV